MTKLDLLQEQFRRATDRLGEVLALPKSDVIRDSAIQRFEFCFDLCWKLLKEQLREEFGVDVASPKGCFREAYRQGLLEFENRWIEFCDLRNRTVHTYNEVLAEEVYSKLPAAHELFVWLRATLETRG